MELLQNAIAYERSGDKQEAIRIYHKLIALNQNAVEARVGIMRLRGEWRRFSGVEEEHKNFFIDAQGQRQILEIERWLLR
ncbi:hypothetical protein [Helicobacter brantae]|uniref:Tetratricopeptide repeat protein n=1 Tax=Helicobacter brantae TaxID=375927 RepID=A0A3D8J1V0_9HELI|nr:hypothetical protein [Helicobacter brantae]RDU71210.1 hypothetical protein CQA58_03600 [Helicobacter brantae]